MLQRLQIKSCPFIIKGMQRDLSVSKFNPEFAYENMNMRIAPIKESTMASLTNEKGTIYSSIYGVGGLEYESKLRNWYNSICPFEIYKDQFYGEPTVDSVDKPELESGDMIGVPIGQALLNNELTVFTTELDNSFDIEVNERYIEDFEFDEFTINDINISNNTDRIYKLWLSGDKLCGKLLYKGHLNFDYRSPIETMVFYENSDLRKVYWTDGINQPRFINISAKDEKIASWNNTSFDFVRTLRLEEEVTIRKNLNGGLFPAGCVQYIFTYYNLFGAESNVFYTSPILYSGFQDRGASPEETTSNSFTINIKNLDVNFDYVRIYSLVRTSIDNIPTVKLVTSIQIPIDKIDGTYQITYTDTNTNGSNVDPTELLYVGGEMITAYTFTQKDNTMFLGNVEQKRPFISKSIRDNIRSIVTNTKKDGDDFKKGINGKYPLFKFYNDDGKRFLESQYTYIDEVCDAVIAYNNNENKKMLSMNSNNIKYFQKGEIYRMGLQFQHYTGKWSDAVWIGDYKSDVGIGTISTYDDDSGYLYTTYKTGARGMLDMSKSFNDDLKSLIRMGYRKVRPIVVYPTINERLNIAQGVLNPTMFGTKNRVEGTEYAKASYYFRPYNRERINNREGIDNGYYRIFAHLNMPCSYNDRASEFDTMPYLRRGDTTEPFTWDDDNVVASKYMNFPVIDHHIVTMNSPEFEFDTDMYHIDTSQLKLKIVGAIDIDDTYTDMSLTTFSSPKPWWNLSKVGEEIVRSKFVPNGFYHTKHHGRYGLVFMSSFSWVDNIEDLVTNNKDGVDIISDDTYDAIKQYFYAWRICPWQQTGSLNNSKPNNSGDVSSKLKNKKMSTRLSSRTRYGDIGWSLKPADIKLWSSDQNEVIKLNDNIYRGNVDELIVGDSDYSKKFSVVSRGDNYTDYSSMRGLYISNDIRDLYGIQDDKREYVTDSRLHTNPISVKYKSNIHMVFDLGRVSTDLIILPEAIGYGVKNEDHMKYGNTSKLTKYTSKKIDIDKIVGTDTDYMHSFLWLGQLYREESDVINRFGGITDEALQSNKFMPCGEPVQIYDYMYDENDEIVRDQDGTPELRVADKIVVKWLEGDTYYQNYECLKTYPFTLDDENSIVEILDFNVETRINLAGRYDRNNYKDSNLVALPTNFNMINNIYSQKNNFYRYSQQNLDMNNLTSYPNSITWTKTKLAGQDVDQWTNITMASFLDLDGDKGKINKLVRLNDQLISIQDKGISQILYNEQMQMTTTDGMPIEIANSGKVTGKRYVSEHIGCQNKWSICITPKACYFIDDLTKGIYSFGTEGLSNMSNSLGFHSWINEKSKSLMPWNPVTFSNIVSYYDKKNEDVLFFTDKECLAYSEQIGQFTSFFSYEKTPYYSPIEDRALFLSNACCEHCGYMSNYKTWFQHEGDYNMFFNQYRPFYTTVIANPDMTTDKVFNNLEFRSDTWTKDGVLLEDTFDTLTVWDEYQSNTQTLLYHQGMPSTLKKKFRIWHAEMPRDKRNIMDRMRNPWVYVKLAMNEVNTNKTILHDMNVYYYG